MILSGGVCFSLNKSISFQSKKKFFFNTICFKEMVLQSSLECPFKAVISKQSCLGVLGLLTAYKTVKGVGGATLPLFKKFPRHCHLDENA